MKAIYTRIGNSIYQLNQDTNVPYTVCNNTAGINATVNIDPSNHYISQNVFINTLKTPSGQTLSNREMYEQMVRFIKDKLITEIPLIQNTYKVYIDYSVFEGGREVDHSAVIRPVTPEDSAILLGVTTNNETVYRRVKHFKPRVEFSLKNALPYGIMAAPRTSYMFRINSLCIFQDFSKRPEMHPSTYCNAYTIHPSSQTIQHGVESMTMIYSSSDEGIVFNPVETGFSPRRIQVMIDIILADYIVAYNDEEINQILDENMEIKYKKEHPVPPCPHHPHPHPRPFPPGPRPDPENPDEHMFPEEERNVPADGDFTPSAEGYFDYYERARKTTPNSLLVVEDSISDSIYEPITMIKKSLVIKDIPDVQVGDYVIYRESWSVETH